MPRRPIVCPRYGPQLTAVPARTRQPYGQHFLGDDHYVQRILSAINPEATDRLVEIGPGDGALTLPLLGAVNALTAIEMDTGLIPDLTARAAEVGKLEIIEADVLAVDLGELAYNGPLRLVGNLPYYASSPILFHCLEHADAIADMHFMLQKEVVARMAAGPGSKTYGRLSVMLQLHCRVQALFDVPPGAFRPPPRVDSAVVRLEPLPASERPGVDSNCLQAVVKAAFGQRRKTLGNALRSLLDAAAIRAAGVDPRGRAEQLAPGEFVDLARIYAGTLA